LSFNLFSIIDFPARSQNKSASLIDNIFFDYTQSGKYLVYPSINGFSDHDDAQLLILKDNCMQMHKQKISNIRIFNDQCLFNFKMQLSYETLDDVFGSDDVDTIFNSFLNTYLRIFHSSFPIKKICCSKLKLVTG
jgi:hypothetical protein